tara:strand:- start:5976 stop:6923 length:948 start_codon:yes stop_codon:yes gene_type:complete
MTTKVHPFQGGAASGANSDITSLSGLTTPLTVAQGGVGAGTLTDGGLLVGSGTDAITAMGVLADGEVIVGDGTTDPVAESGATLRTSIGVGTGDSPTFTGVTHSGNVTGADDAGPAVVNEAVSVTNPVFVPDKADLTTGIGGADGGGNLALIVGGAQALTVNSDGSVNNSLQPCFLTTRNGTSHNVTGAGTAFTLQLVSEVYDQTADFNVSTYTFTAPIGGRYELNARVAFSGVTAAADQADLNIITSNRTYLTRIINTNNMNETGNMQIDVIADMDAGDTAYVTLTVSGEATDVVDVIGLSATVQTHFSGHLVA